MSISIKDLNKVYPNGNHALKDINLEIPTGMFGLLGPNGAGKSTLMRILVALMEPSSGQVNICGYDLFKQRKEIRGILGYLPQDFRFFAKYKTHEFLDYAARLSGMTNGKQRKQAVDAMLENVGLFDVRERYANKLSGGMKRRLGIAQALIHHPKVIIVDEPTTGLDPEERIRFRGIISALSQQKIVLLSTHIVSDIEAIANRVILLKKGSILAVKRPADLLGRMEGKVWSVTVGTEHEPEFVQKFSCSNIIHMDGKSVIRLISEQRPWADAIPQPPNMEDMYLYYFGQ